MPNTVHPFAPVSRVTCNAGAGVVSGTSVSVGPVPWGGASASVFRGLAHGPFPADAGVEAGRSGQVDPHPMVDIKVTAKARNTTVFMACLSIRERAEPPIRATLA